MFTLCCTQKLFKRTKLPVEPLIADTTTALGNWYADLVFFSRTQLLLFVNENSRLAVITPAIDARLLASHLTTHLVPLLEQLSVPHAWIEAEVELMREVRLSKTESRSVLGTMNEYRYQIDLTFDDRPEESPLALALYLSGCLVGPLGYRQPKEVLLELLGQRYRRGE